MMPRCPKAAGFADNRSSALRAQALPWFRERELAARWGQGYAWKTTGCNEASFSLADDRRTAPCAGEGRKAGSTPAHRL